MAIVNPCCCISPRIGTLLIGIFHLLIAMPWCAIFTGYEHYDSEKDTKTGIIVCVITVSVLGLLSCLLFLGVQQELACVLRLCLIIQECFILWIFAVIGFQLPNNLSYCTVNISFYLNIVTGVGCLYGIWIVHAYLLEVRPRYYKQSLSSVAIEEVGTNQPK